MATTKTTAPLDHYAQLGVTRDADDNTIKRSFRKLALKWHPDKNASVEAKAKFAAIREAYEVLSKEETKLVYDIGLRCKEQHLSRAKERADGHGPSTEFYEGYRRRSRRHERGDGYSSTQPNMSGAQRSPRFPHPPNRAPECVKHQLPCSLEDLYLGFQRKLKVTRKVEDRSGNVVVETVILTVEGSPGCKDGTAIAFPGAGDRWYGAPPQVPVRPERSVWLTRSFRM